MSRDEKRIRCEVHVCKLRSTLAPSPAIYYKKVGEPHNKNPLAKDLHSDYDECVDFRRDMIFVIACRITVPAFSVSFLLRPEVTHTLSAG